MTKQHFGADCAWKLSALSFLCASLATTVSAQDRLPHYPGYEQYQRMSAQMRGETYTAGRVNVTWSEDGKSFDYQWSGKSYHYDTTTQSQTEGAAATAGAAEAGGRGGRRGGRGGGGGGRGGRGGNVLGGGGSLGGGGIARNLSNSTASPDGNSSALSRDGNLYVSDANGGNEVSVTTDGSKEKRIRYGVPTIIYGEELGMSVGMWWSPDSKKLAYYRFDEGKVPDYTVLLGQSGASGSYDHLEVDPYPKAGVMNAEVELYVYDLETKKSTKIDVRDGKPFADDTVGYYVYRLAWTHDSKELLFSRMNRRQNTLELAAADLATGKCRVIVHEEWLANWVDWVPGFQYLADHQRFIWTSERNGFKNFYLYNLKGELLATLTDHQYEVANLVKIDETAGVIYYMARDGDNYMKLQLHRVGLDGKGDVRLTDPAFTHSVELSPDGKYFIDVAETHDQPPMTRLLDDQGKVLKELAKSDLTRFEQLGLKKVELFTFKAGDGVTDLHGMLSFPSNFDPTKKYPVLLSVYGGPVTSAARETFSTPNSMAEYGFLVVSLDSRSLSGRGRKFSDPFYGHLGIVEMDDQAAGIKELEKRAYVDANHVGVFGTSYGGTAAATLLLRFPDIFQAASSSSPVTDYRNYNAIYGERYEGLVSDNKAGYDAAMVMTYVNNLKGRLLLYYGTADNNVHNSNALQLIQAFQRAGKNIEVQVGPDLGHTGVNQARMMEFLIENLVMK
jgi:dipeptidyl-peptidase 4